MLESLSDYDLQVRGWTGAGPEVWSPCEAADEAEYIQIDAFLQQTGIALSSDTIASIHRLIRFIDESDILDDETATAADTPVWVEIRRLAAEGLIHFANDVGHAGFGDLAAMSSAERIRVQNWQCPDP